MNTITIPEIESPAYFKLALRVLKDDLEDLQRWSVYNKDRFNNELNVIETAVKIIEEQL